MEAQKAWNPQDVVIDIRLVRGSEEKRVRRTHVRLCRGAYVSAQWWETAPAWQRFMAVAWGLALTIDGIVFCCATALMLQGFPVGLTPSHLHISRRQRSRAGKHPSAVTLRGKPVPHAPGTHVHVHPEAETTVVNGFTVMKSLEAMTWVLGRERLEASIPFADGLLRADPARRQLLEANIAELQVGTQRRQAAGALSVASELSESGGESLSRVAMMRLGVQPPELQREVVLGDGRIVRPDYTWKDVSVAGEFDGRSKYLDQAMRGAGRDQWDVLRAEKERDDALRRHFRVVVHWTAEDRRTPSRLRAKLAAAGVPIDPRTRTRLR